MIIGLNSEWRSHLFTKLNNRKFPASYGEEIAAIHAEWYVNANKDDVEYPKPILLPKPWDETTPTETVTSSELESARADLLARSAFSE